MKNQYPQSGLRRSTQIAETLKLNYSSSRCLLLERFSYIVLLALTILFSAASFAQTGINAFTSVMSSSPTGGSYTGPGAGVGGSAQSEYMPGNNNSFTCRFGSNSGLATNVRSVNGYMAGGSSFNVIANVVTSVMMRRVNNPGVGGTKDILFFAGTRNPGVNTTGQTNSSLTIDLNAPYVTSMSVAFFQNNLLIGTDNIFSNQGNANDNNNNIERVDVLIAGGYTIPNAQKYGFPILERGIYGAHDAFKIAVVTGRDALGNPTAYSNVVSVAATNYNNSSSSNPVADGTYDYFLFKRNGQSNNMRVDQHVSNQGIGGVSFRFADFGIANGTTIYGYSIMSDDFNSALGSDVVNFNNAARYPINTSESVGGLDILAVLGIAMETTVLPVEVSSFNATKKENKVALEWTTATEMNNRGFRVERSANGKDWMEIGFVQSKAPEGNGTEMLHYSFYDNNPMSGINHYRLKQLDLDNNERISEIKTVSLGSKAGTIKLFPNPVVNTMHLEGMEAGTRFRLVDARGAVLNNFTAHSSTEVISTEKLLPGIYFVQVMANNSASKTMQLVKL